METLQDFYGEADYLDCVESLRDGFNEAHEVMQILVVLHPEVVPAAREGIAIEPQRIGAALHASSGLDRKSVV